MPGPGLQIGSLLMHPAVRQPAASPRAPACRRQGGFSLLETLVAFSVLAISLGTLLRVFGGGGQAALLTDEYARGLIVAESMLASLGTEIELTEGRQRGVVAGLFRWQVDVSPLPLQTGNLSNINFPSLPYWVEVSASWGTAEPRTIRLGTIRLLRVQAPGGAPNLPSPSGAGRG